MLIPIVEIMLGHIMKNMKLMVSDTSLPLVYLIMQLNVELQQLIQTLDVSYEYDITTLLTESFSVGITPKRMGLFQVHISGLQNHPNSIPKTKIFSLK